MGYNKGDQFILDAFSYWELLDPDFSETSLIDWVFATLIQIY